MNGSKQYLYWIDPDGFPSARKFLKEHGYRVSPAILTPCQVMRAEGKHVVYASPDVWSRICVRQSTWYQSSAKAGHYMVMSAERLDPAFDSYLEAELSATDFQPERLPTAEELTELVSSPEYRERKPEGWEAIGIKDALMFKVMFTLTRFWGSGDNLKKHWLGQRANHANFLAKRFTTRFDGDDVAYSVTENKSVCSSCAEFFNVIEDDSRKLVRACPGSVVFGGAPRQTYLDVRPINV